MIIADELTFVSILMELGLQVALVRGHPGDEGLWLGVPIISKSLALQWQDPDVSTCQVCLPIQAPLPASLMYDITHVHIAEPQYPCLHNGGSHTLSFPEAFITT